MQVSRNAFLKFTVAFLGTGGALATACSDSTSDSPGSSGGSSGSSSGTSGTSGTRGTSGTSSGTRGSSGSSGSSGTSGSSGDAGADSGDAGKDAGDAGDAGGATCAANGAKDTAIATNHAGSLHALVVPMADFVTPAMKTYTIKGASAHDHSITLTAAQLTMLKAGTPVTVTSTTGNGHMHAVTVGCVP